MIFDKLRRRKDDLDIPPLESPATLPDDLERFRMKPPDTEPPEIKPTMPETRNDYPEVASYGKTVEELVAERTSGDKIELILQKLETIDARLKLIEEKIKRY